MGWVLILGAIGVTIDASKSGYFVGAVACHYPKYSMRTGSPGTEEHSQQPLGGSFEFH